jgi:hypothetical protein
MFFWIWLLNCKDNCINIDSIVLWFIIAAHWKTPDQKAVKCQYLNVPSQESFEFISRQRESIVSLIEPISLYNVIEIHLLTRSSVYLLVNTEKNSLENCTMPKKAGWLQVRASHRFQNFRAILFPYIFSNFTEMNDVFRTRYRIDRQSLNRVVN